MKGINVTYNTGRGIDVGDKYCSTHHDNMIEAKARFDALVPGLREQPLRFWIRLTVDEITRHRAYRTGNKK